MRQRGKRRFNRAWHAKDIFFQLSGVPRKRAENDLEASLPGASYAVRPRASAEIRHNRPVDFRAVTDSSIRRRIFQTVLTHTKKTGYGLCAEYCTKVHMDSVRDV